MTKTTILNLVNYPNIKVKEKGGYPVKIDIIEQRAGTLYIRSGKARRVTKKDGFVYYLVKTSMFKKPFKTKPVKYEYLYVTKDGYKVYLYSPSPDQYIPLELDIEGGTLKAIDEDLRLFLIDSVIDSQTRFKPLTFMHKYFPIIAIVMVAVSIAVIMFASADMLQTAGGTISQSANILEKVSGSLSGVQSVG